MPDEQRAAAAFDQKMDPTIVEARYTARLADMITGETAADLALVAVDDAVRTVLSAADPAPPATDVIWYLTFGRICWRLNETYPDNVRDAEEANIEALWVSRGLDEDICDDIVTAINAL
jgi:hypothetical protein